MGNNAYKKRHKELGLCTECSRPAIPFSTKCIIHHYSHNKSSNKHNANNRKKCNENNAKARIKYRKENRCTCCGAPLMEEGYVQCINCRSGIHKERGTF